MSLYPKKSIIPPGGYHYVEQHNGIKVELRGNDVEHLAEVILRFRLNNGIPTGNPLQDVTDFICGQWPHFCAESEAAHLPPKNVHAKRHISTRASEWLARLWRLGTKNSAKQQTAEARAAICAACPQNIDYRPGGCGSCIDSLERLAFVWLRQRATPFDASLGACRVTGQLNKLAVHAGDLPPLDEVQTAALPTKCWRKV